MTYFGVVLAGLARRKSQIGVTFACIGISFLLFGVLLSAREAFTVGVTEASSYRLRSGGANAVAEALPLVYASKIGTVPGVRFAIYASAEPAAYQDDPRHLLLQLVPAQNFFETFPELRIAKEQQEAFKSEKRSLIAGRDAMTRYGWSLGQTVVLQTNVLDTSGAASWEFRLDAIYDSDDPKIPSDLTFVRYEYFNDARGDNKDRVLGFITTIADREQTTRVASDIDRLFATSTPRLRTQTENDAAEKQLAQFGDFNTVVSLISGMVFLSMFLLAHNVWQERVHMRRGEFAIMKALGFSSGAIAGLVTAEAMMLTVASAVCGLTVAWYATALIKPHVQNILTGFHFPTLGIAVGAVVTLVFGGLSSALPAYRAATTPLTAMSRD